MEQEARRVVTGRPETEELNVEHVGEPCDRVIPAVVPRRKCPANALRRQAREDVGILVDVGVVVGSDESVADRSRPDEENRRGEENAEEQIPAPRPGDYSGFPGPNPPFAPGPGPFRTHAERLVYRPMRRPTAVGIFFCATLLLRAQFALGASKLDARIFAGKAPEEPASFLVVMRDQADLSGAEAFTDKAEKGTFVYEALAAQADASQAALRADLDARGI